MMFIKLGNTTIGLMHVVKVTADGCVHFTNGSHIFAKGHDFQRLEQELGVNEAPVPHQSPYPDRRIDLGTGLRVSGDGHVVLKDGTDIVAKGETWEQIKRVLKIDPANVEPGNPEGNLADPTGSVTIVQQ